MTFFVFDECFDNNASNRVVCIAPHDEVVKYKTTDALNAEFGGYIIYEDFAGDRFLGVWGNRKAGRFRRLLVAQGIDASVANGRPTGARVLLRCVHR